MPVNFQTAPGVQLTRACFAANQYEHNAFQKCFSNLLAVGFRRFVADVYWDPLRQEWSLCPVEMPRSDGDPSDGGEVQVSTGQTVVPSSDTSKAVIPVSTVPVPPGGKKRQETSTSDLPLAPQSSVPPTSSSSSVSSSVSASASPSPTIITFPNPNGAPMLQIGNYNCTSQTTFDLLTGILNNFLESTSTTTGASLILFSFNLHAAASLTNPNGPAPSLSPNQLPGSGQLLSDLLRGNLSDDIYRPTRLADQRADLNDSWYNVAWNSRPLQGYYVKSENAQGQLSTTSGWPTEAFMEFKELFRLIASFGSVDPQMKSYNIAGDSGYVFPPGTIAREIETSVGSDGQVTSGCLFSASEDAITSATNSSWAVSTAPPLDISAQPDLFSPIPSIGNMTACGTTPLLNQTLAGSTADKNPLPYAAYVHSTLWTFAPGEPLNATQGDKDDSINRCVVMMKSPYPSRWRVADCRDSHRVACHDPENPYKWRISDKPATYNDAESQCTAPYRFSVPHTALENSHLYAEFLASSSPSSPSSSSDSSSNNNNNNNDVLYLNLNSINTPDCWVVGRNETCPYLPTAETDRTKIVVVPTVAAVIIFLLAVMTFFLKCAANRRENKRGRKRRLVDGWEYEGVPS